MKQYTFSGNTELTLIPGDYTQSSGSGITFTATAPTTVTAKPPAVPPKAHKIPLQRRDTVAILSSDGSITVTVNET